MSIIQALILGILQGIAEFLPISSSGHLKLGQILFGLADLDRYLLFDVCCHSGTLLAIVTVLRSDIRRLFTKDRQTLGCIAIATLPLFPCALFLGPLKSVIDTPQYLGLFFLGTALILFAGHRFAKQHPNTNATTTLEQKKWKHSLIIGLSQALALFPGISRCGSTISAMRILGWEEMQAKRFCFFLAIPAVLGSICLEALHLLFDNTTLPSLSPWAYLIGFLAAFAVGRYTFLMFLYVLKLSSFRYFGWYCLALSTLSTAFFSLN